MTALKNGKFIFPDEVGNFFVTTDFSVKFDKKIVEIGNFSDGEFFDAENNFVAPGFINIHIHGCNNADVMDATSDALKKICEFLPSSGVTSFLPTTMTMKISEISHALENVRDNKNNFSGAKILGVNLEGPFINEKFCGAQDKKNIIPADFNFVEKFKDIIEIVTFAPEKLENFSFVDNCIKNKIICAIGHSAADYETAKKFIERGANHITHLYNAQTGFHHRKPGIVGAAFDSNATVEIISDNLHVHPVAQKIAWKIKNRGEIILITDSCRACGVGEGEFNLGGQKIFVKKNIATLADGTIAASVATLNQVMKNFRENTQATVAETVELVTKNPARKLKIYDKVGSIEVGKSADFVIFDENFNIKKVFIDGKIFY